MSLLLLFLLQAAGPKAPATSTQPFTVQLGSRVTPDTVTVGQRFILLLKVRAPLGATIQFPAGVDSAIAASPTAPQIIGTPLRDSVPDASGTTRTAAYRFTAWDVGLQRLGLSSIAISVNGKTEYVSLADQAVFVRSVLPADTTQRQPKPPRPPIVLVPFNWWPLVALLIALLLALLAWWLWRWYRRRRAAPLPPFETAEREFARIEAMGLVESGDAERYVVLMTDVMRDYLAARVEGITRSQTRPELISAAAPIHAYAAGLADLLSRGDLVKFARERISPDEARALGRQARTIVRQVEDHFVSLEKEKAEKAKKAEKPETREKHAA
jgi:hypothetical protein